MSTPEKLAALKALLDQKPGRTRLAAALGDFRRQAREERQLQMMVEAYGAEETIRMLRRFHHRRHLEWTGYLRHYWGA
jgi:hypothetical protein